MYKYKTISEESVIYQRSNSIRPNGLNPENRDLKKSAYKNLRSASLSQAKVKELLRLFRFLHEDMTHTKVPFKTPPSWLLKQLIEQSSLHNYSAKNWHYDIICLLKELEQKADKEHLGTVQFYNCKTHDPLFSSKQCRSYSLTQLIFYIQTTKRYVESIQEALGRKVH